MTERPPLFASSRAPGSRTPITAAVLLIFAAVLAGCGGAPRPTTEIDRGPSKPTSGSPVSGSLTSPASDSPQAGDRETKTPRLPVEDATATPEQRMMVAGWRESFQHSATMEGTEPDSILFFRYQALLAHLDPERIPADTAPILHAESEQLRQTVAHHRDEAWLRWQADSAPPPEPLPAPEEDVTFAIRPEMNDRVQHWLDYFTGPGRGTFALWYWRSGAYRPRMEEILREEGVPPELLAVVYIESGFNPTARSRAAAVGAWQFISGTGKRYGLQINRHRDERRDFELATRAASRYLKDLYGYFNDWNLALAAYNCGEYRVFRELAKQGGTQQGGPDFWSLDLPRQTEDYVPEFHAVLHILARPQDYGFSDSLDQPLQFDVVELPGPVRVNDLASHSGTLVDDVKRLNPSWLRNITPADGRSVQARLPKGALDRFAVADLPLVPLSEARNVAAFHKVRRGETLRSIARRYHVATAVLARENGLSAKSRVKTGRLLRLPASAEGDSFAEVRSSKSKKGGSRGSAHVSRGSKGGKRSVAAGPRFYTVRRGDTLASIAKRHDVSVAQLRQKNGLASRGVIRAGQKLRVG